MRIKKLFFETSILLTIITLFVVIFNTVQVQTNSAHKLKEIQEQYLNATFEIYQNQLVGDILIGDKNIINSLLKEISEIRNVGVALDSDSLSSTFGPIQESTLSSKYELNIDNEKNAILKLYAPQRKSNMEILYESVFPVVFEVIILCLGIFYLLRRIKLGFISPLDELVINMGAGKIESYVPNKKSVLELKNLCSTLKKMNIDIKNNASYEAEVRAAKQVAHDIRSPLASLNLLASAAVTLPEKQRILMRTSIQRITDIANVLQKKGDDQATTSYKKEKVENVMLVTLVEQLVTESRIQLGISSKIYIDLEIENAYGLFANVNVTEFNRVLSNLINNSIESFDECNHCVKISIYQKDNNIVVDIEDDGKGIPENILNLIGQYGFSYGKKLSNTSGHGLGIYHAQNTIQSFNGSFHIQSREGIGTLVSIILPLSMPPSWFVNDIKLGNLQNILILDDDLSIHQLWTDRFDQCINKIDIQYFNTPDKLECFLKASSRILQTSLILIDYEFVGLNINGLDVIEKLQINNCSILVTSHFDDIQVRERAQTMGVKIIPKTIVPFVPIV